MAAPLQLLKKYTYSCLIKHKMLGIGNNLRMKKCTYIALKIVSLTKELPGPYTLIRTQ